MQNLKVELLEELYIYQINLLCREKNVDTMNIEKKKYIYITRGLQDSDIEDYCLDFIDMLEMIKQEIVNDDFLY